MTEVIFGCIAILFFYCLYYLPRLIKIARYRRTSYYKITKKPWPSLDQGAMGEFLIYKELKKFERKKGKFLFNLYIPKAKQGTTEIDVTLIHPKGFFVIESKNFSGWIFGHEKDKTWTQTLPNRLGFGCFKFKFANPIRQNETHITSLKHILGKTVPMWSIIVFSDHCILKEVAFSHKARCKVVQLQELKATVSRIIKETAFKTFSSSEIQSMYDQLYPYSQISNQIKRDHVRNLHS